MTEYCPPRYLSQADCVLVTRALEEIPACSVVLAKESKVFDELLSSAEFERNTAGQKKLPMTEDKELLLLFRNILHDGEFDFNVNERVFDLAQLAHKFSVRAILHRVDSKLCQSESSLPRLLEESEVHGTLHQAASLELSGLLQKATERVLSNPAWLQNWSVQQLGQLPNQPLGELLKLREASTAAELESRRNRISELEGKADEIRVDGLREMRLLMSAWTSAIRSKIIGSTDGMRRKEAVALRTAVREAAQQWISSDLRDSIFLQRLNSHDWN